MIIPGANISLGGIQIPVSQGISIPSATSVQLPVSVAGAVQLGAGGAGSAGGAGDAGGDKAGDGAKDSKPSSPTAQGRCTAATGTRSAARCGENFPGCCGRVLSVPLRTVIEHGSIHRTAFTLFL